MNYTSTRNNKISILGAQAIVKGLSGEGGLFVPSGFPALTQDDFNALCNMEYSERAAFIIAKFLPELAAELPQFCSLAYSKFEDNDPAPLIKIGDNRYMLELWHGPTYAFKDVALTLLPHLLVASKQKLGDTTDTLILVATSGDTGKAALEGFKDIGGTRVVVLYPKDGVSALQKLQMQTTTGGNVRVFGIKGNFDDAQNAVKEVFADIDIAEKLAVQNVKLSSANSINFGRLVPQIVYYFSSYTDLINSRQVKYGDKINFCVPTGNFGNILAGYYAMRMGLPVNKLICASNSNKVLADFFNKGEYNLKGREFHCTTSPSMDILISSNLERLLFELFGRDSAAVVRCMQSLNSSKISYKITATELTNLQKYFYADFATEDEVADTLAQEFDDSGYIVDPHTAVALCVYKKYVKQTRDKTPTVILSTASPYKFAADVLEMTGERASTNDKKNISALEDLTALPIPATLKELFKLPLLHSEVIDKGTVQRLVIRVN